MLKKSLTNEMILEYRYKVLKEHKDYAKLIILEKDSITGKKDRADRKVSDLSEPSYTLYQRVFKMFNRAIKIHCGLENYGVSKTDNSKNKGGKSAKDMNKEALELSNKLITVKSGLGKFDNETKEALKLVIKNVFTKAEIDSL